MERIAVWRPPGIGDVLLLTPTLQAIQAVHPDWQIALWGQIDAAYMLLAAGLVDEAHDVTKGFRPTEPIDHMLGFARQPVELLEMCESFGIEDAVVVPWLTRTQHQARYFHWAAQHLLGPLPWMEEVLDIPDAPIDAAWRDAILLYGHTTTEDKKWPLDRYIALADRFARDGHRVAFIEGPGDRYPVTLGYPILTRQLLPMAWLQRHARLWVGNDTGPTHLAALLGCPTVALFGSSHLPTWHPLGPTVTSLQTCERNVAAREIRWCSKHDCWRDMTVDLVYRAAVTRMARHVEMGGLA